MYILKPHCLSKFEVLIYSSNFHDYDNEDDDFSLTDLFFFYRLFSEGENTSVKCFDPDTSTERFSWHDDYRKRILEEIFVLSPYLNSCEHTELASNLGMEKKTLQVCKI